MPPFPMTPEEEDILRSVLEPEQLVRAGIAPGLRPKRAAKSPTLTPEEESDVVADLDEGRDVGGLEMAANLLDIPGAVVRNTLAGKNPFTPIMHPISGEDRISGRDLLEQYDLVEPNVDKGWTPDAGDVAGFGADVLLDPLNMFGGFGAYLKGAQKSAKPLGAGIRAGERALLGIKPHPFTRGSEWGIGTGENAAKFADMLGGAGKVVSESYPGRYAKSILNARYMNTISKEAQPHAKALFDEFAGMEADTRGQVAKYMNELMDAGVITPENIRDRDFSKATEWGRRYRREFELGDRPVPFAPPHPDPMDPLMARILGEQKERLQNLKNDARLAAVIAPDLDEPITKLGYHPRGISGEDPLSPREMVFGARDLASHGREEWLKGLWEGTDKLQDIISDPEVAATAKQWAGNRNAAKEIGDVIHRKFAHEFAAEDPGAILRQAREIGGMINRMDPAIRNIGGYGNFPFVDYMSHELSRRRATAAAKKVVDMIDLHGKELSAFQRHEPSTSVIEILNSVGMNPGGVNTYGALPILAQRRGLSMIDPNVMDQLSGLRVSKELGRDMQRIFETIRGPQNITDVMKLYDSMTNFTKAFLLAHPARYNRDRATGFIQNLATGNTALGPEKMWYAMRTGQDIPGASKIPKLVEMLTQRGLPVDDANATKMMREVVFAHQPISSAETTFGGIPRPPGGVEEILGEMPGLMPFKYADALKAGSSWNPLNIRGVLDRKTGELRDYTSYRPIAGMEHIGYGFDTANRMPPFFKNMMEGMDPAEAKKLVDELQVSYNPRGYSEFEKKIAKRAFPFYSFTSRMLPRIVKELTNNPAGPIAQMVRRANVFRGDREGDPIPEHLKESLAIGLGELPDGSKRYLSGLGLMHEDPLSLISSNPQDMALELLSRVNPIPKVLIEQAFGQSTFQRGPEGGRPLDELDPPIGRTLSNIAGIAGVEGYQGNNVNPKKLSPGAFIEHVASNSPLSRLLSSARTATDPRKEWWAKGLNLLSGVRIYDASEGAMDATLRKLLEQAEKKTGARSYTKVYFSKEQLEEMTPAERKAADRMRSLSKMLDVRAKKRRQEKEEKETAA